MQIAAIRLKRHVAANIDAVEIHRGIAIPNPIGQHVTDAPGGLNTDGVEASRDV